MAPSTTTAHHHHAHHPPQTALLVIDVQNFFTPMTKQALPQITTLIHHFRAQALPVLFTQHGHPASDLAGPPYPNQLVRKWGPAGSIHRGTAPWELQPAVQALLEDLETDEREGRRERGWADVVQKNTYDAFVGTDLEERLRRLEVARVVVCGVMTDCCCDTTARAAFDRGWETWLVEDACGSASRKQHEAGLRGFAFAFGDVVGTGDVLAEVKGE
ncbi:cysteine hydrolase [Diplodia corticola]|uniref:Cysteine hydrolase n=1 Tax=Diplodia corticola TaxID=236234 RepID=A0A1J9S5M6_9PEZI|nr:cysteine hydrolase [Diplodia corticola]OJD40267.1 cysteine hydrolase [Diplodia corticola]